MFDIVQNLTLTILNILYFQVVHELIETPLKNPSGHGVMVVLRIASEKLGRLAHER